ncbi:MAG: hypothetical protein DCC55_19350 [Chloroflexi bacterium]|nr:MAG: hypothetical protein DCC55_19350 [Chloroflexota bacterium]
MATLLLRDLPDHLHRKLKRRATANHRSMAKEALALLESALAAEEIAPPEPPQPFVGRFPLTDALLDEAKSEGRA